MKFDLRITAVVIVALALQTGGALLWAGRAAARLDEMEAQVAAARPLSERLARLEAQMNEAQASLDRIEKRLDKSLDRPR